jgi:hypothetical protein
MESTRSLRRHGNVLPAVFTLLADLPAGSVPHAAHGLRAPGAIYNLSMSRVLAAFEAVLGEIEALDRVADEHAALDRGAVKTLAAQVELLEAMMAHMDDGFQVLKACHAPQPEIDEPFADRWLEKVGHATVRHYKNAIKPYRQCVAPIVNRVKHEHGQLRLVVFSDERTRVPGYYVEGVQAGGVVGPDPKIHPGNTALSFNRDLRFHFVHLFEIGNALKAALSPALRALGIRTTGRVVQNQSAAFLAVAERLAGLGTTVFPDEVRKSSPHVRVRREGDDAEVTVRYPSLAVFQAPPNMRVTVLTRGDGYTTQYRVPYWQPQPGTP